LVVAHTDVRQLLSFGEQSVELKRKMNFFDLIDQQEEKIQSILFMLSKISS